MLVQDDTAGKWWLRRAQAPDCTTSRAAFGDLCCRGVLLCVTAFLFQCLSALRSMKSFSVE